MEVVHPIDVSLLCAYKNLFHIYLSDCACPCIFPSLSCLAHMRVWASSRAADVGRAGGWGGVEQCCECEDTLPHTLPDLIFFVHSACFKASPTPPVRRGRSEGCPSSEDGCESRKVRRKRRTLTKDVDADTHVIMQSRDADESQCLHLRSPGVVPGWRKRYRRMRKNPIHTINIPDALHAHMEKKDSRRFMHHHPTTIRMCASPLPVSPGVTRDTATS